MGCAGNGKSEEFYIIWKLERKEKETEFPAIFSQRDLSDFSFEAIYANPCECFRLVRD